jgi:hypothetical protein
MRQLSSLVYISFNTKTFLKGYTFAHSFFDRESNGEQVIVIVTPFFYQPV